MSIPMPAAKRKLFIHAAHRNVGLSDAGIALPPYCRLDGFSEDFAAPRSIHPLQLLILGRKTDANSRRIIARLEQIIAERCGAQCRCANIEEVGENHSAHDADCLIVVAGGICIARRRASLPTGLANENRRIQNDFCIWNVDISAPARWHPVLNGVEPFICVKDFVECDENHIPPENAIVLLAGRPTDSQSKPKPLAWAYCERQGRVFRTSLGSSDDLRRPPFLRLLQNAVAWVATQ